MNTTAINNIVHQALASGASKKDLAILTPKYLEKLGKRISNVYRHHHSKLANKPTQLLLGKPLDMPCNTTWDGLQSKRDEELTKDTENLGYLLKDLCEVFEGEFNPNALISLGDSFPLESWGECFDHPAWKRFANRLAHDVTSRLVTVLNKFSTFGDDPSYAKAVASR